MKKLYIVSNKEREKKKLKMAIHLLQFKNFEYDFFQIKTALYEKIFKDYPFYLHVCQLLEKETSTSLNCPKHKLPDCCVRRRIDVAEEEEEEENEEENYSKSFRMEKIKFKNRMKEKKVAEKQMRDRFRFLLDAMARGDSEKVRKAAGDCLYKKLLEHSGSR